MPQVPYPPRETPHNYQPVPVAVPVDGIVLAGDLCVTPESAGLVIFAHGSGSSRFSPRNRFVADVLHHHMIGTLLIDLLTSDEEKLDEQTYQLRFDIPFLARRLTSVDAWASLQPATQDLKTGYFGSSTGGAAALIAAAEKPGRVAVVVSRGGRVDLATEFLSKVKAPTLLIVGENDPQVLTWNKEALTHLNPASQLSVIPGATHLFEEPGTLEEVAEQVGAWFEEHFTG